MTLRSPEGNPQTAIGTREHWELFQRIQSTPLHEAFIDKLDEYLDREYIDSRIAGSEILEALRSESPELLEPYPYEQLGGLFGMTLWNFLAERPEDWRFTRQSNRWDETQGTLYFRPLKIKCRITTIADKRQSPCQFLPESVQAEASAASEHPREAA